MMNLVFKNTTMVYSSAKSNYRYKYQPGGNILSINRPEAGQVKATGSDDWGRFCWTALRGKRDKGVIFITASRVCQESPHNPGAFTAYQQQYTAMREQGILKPNPRKQIWKDLLKLIQSQRTLGFFPVLCLDANGDWDNGDDNFW